MVVQPAEYGPLRNAMAQAEDLSALADLSGQWIEGSWPPSAERRRTRHGLASARPTANKSWRLDGHYEDACYHPLFVFNQFGDLGAAPYVPAHVPGADGWEGLLKPVVSRYRGAVDHFRADAGLPIPRSTYISKAKG